MATSTLPLFPTDDGWPYPDRTGDGAGDVAADDEIDLDALELRVDRHAFADLTELEHHIVCRRYGLHDGSSPGAPASMKQLARDLECTHAEVAVVLGCALDKLRTRLTAP